MRVYDLLVAMPDDRPARWVAMLDPGCDLEMAQRDAEVQFGPGRVLEVREHRGTGQ